MATTRQLRQAFRPLSGQLGTLRFMTTATAALRTAPAHGTSRGRQMLNKVPEVTLYFWIIKVLCTTVGETFADFLNDKVGLGLTGTSILMTVVLVAVLVVQFRKDRYVPGIYWL